MKIEIECVVACYVVLLCVCLMCLWLYELVMVSREKKRVNTPWQVCEYCGAVSAYRKNTCMRCPTCQFYL